MSTKKNKTISPIQLDNAFNFTVSTDPAREIPTLCYLAHKHAADYNIKDTPAIDTQHTQRLCKILQRLGIKCQPDTRQLILDSITQIMNSNAAESVFTLARQRQPTNHSSHIRLIIIGIDNAKDIYHELEIIRQLGAHIQHSLQKNNLFNCQLVADPVIFEPKFWGTLCEGFLMSMHRIRNINASLDKKANSIIAASDKGNFYIHVITSRTKVEKITNIMGRAIVTIRSMFMCQDLVRNSTDPQQLMTPDKFIAFTTAFIEKEPQLQRTINVKIYTADEIKNMGFGLIYASGNTSSRLLILKYNPLPINRDTPPLKRSLKQSPKIVMIGSGIMGDSSNVSADVSNVAMVLATLLGYARLGASEPILAMIPLINIPTTKSSLTGSIIKSYSNLAVKIVDKVGYSSLLRADCIGYAVKKWPRAIIADIISLNRGGQKDVSCNSISSFVEQGVNSALLKGLVISGKIVGEALVGLDLKRYRDTYKDKLKFISFVDNIDLQSLEDKCINNMYSGTAFVSRFIDDSTKWVNINIGVNAFDITNDTYNTQDSYTSGDNAGILGASCVGVRILIDWLLNIRY